MAGTADLELVGLVESAVAGDELAFARIVSAFHVQVYSIAMIVCRERTMAEEAEQSAWARLLFLGEMPPAPGPAAVSPSFDDATADPVGNAGGAPGRFDGALRDFRTADAGSRDEDTDGRHRTLDHWDHSELEAEDPRLGGAWSQLDNIDLLIGARGEEIGSGSIRIDNADGSWSGWKVGLLAGTSREYIQLEGSGACQGLLALLFSERDGPSPTRVHGLVLRAPLPDFPEVPTATRSPPLPPMRDAVLRLEGIRAPMDESRLLTARTL